MPDIFGKKLPPKQFPDIHYHLLCPTNDFSQPLREVYYRRLEILDDLGVKYAMTVDSLDVLCLHPLPPLQQLLGDAHVAACVEHLGCRYILGQGYTSSFLNGGVFLWDVPNSRDIRGEIVARGRGASFAQSPMTNIVSTKSFKRNTSTACAFCPANIIIGLF